MKGNQVVSSYLHLSDIMYQALKAEKYDIFENTLEERGKLIEKSEKNGKVFDEATPEEKSLWKLEIQKADERIAEEMNNYKKKLEAELEEVHKSQAKLRKQEPVNKYSQEVSQAGSLFINRLK